MKKFLQLLYILLVAAAVAGFIIVIGIRLDKPMEKLAAKSPTIVTDWPSPHRIDQALEVAKVFGRDGDCKKADSKLVFMIVDQSDAIGIDSKLVAAVVAKESSCNCFAVSRSGAVGLMQVLIKEHQSEFDFSKVNLFNPKDNLAIGTAILKDYVSKYGLQKGLQHYQGVGKNCDTCDMNYVKKIEAIMEGK